MELENWHEDLREELNKLVGLVECDRCTLGIRLESAWALIDP